jgi:hypothetical protein
MTDVNIVTANVVPASTALTDQEAYVVGTDGVKTASIGDFGFGVVRIGRPAGEPSQVVVHGITEAYVYGADSNLSAEDPIVAGSAGVFKKATVGSHVVRGHVLEAVTTDTKAQVFLY